MSHEEQHLGKQVAQLRIAVCELQVSILKSLAMMEERIMSGIKDFATAQAAFNAQMDTALTDIQTEIATLNTQIAALQNSAGQISAEDQATLDALQATAAKLTAKAAAMDTLTPPPVPPAPPTPPTPAP